MKAKIALTDPDDVDVTITMTTTIREWKRLKAQQSDRAPGWWLASIIRKAIGRAEAHFEETEEYAP